MIVYHHAIAYETKLAKIERNSTKRRTRGYKIVVCRSFLRKLSNKIAEFWDFSSAVYSVKLTKYISIFGFFIVARRWLRCILYCRKLFLSAFFFIMISWTRFFILFHLCYIMSESQSAFLCFQTGFLLIFIFILNFLRYSCLSILM